MRRNSIAAVTFLSVLAISPAYLHAWSNPVQHTQTCDEAQIQFADQLSHSEQTVDLEKALALYNECLVQAAPERQLVITAKIGKLQLLLKRYRDAITTYSTALKLVEGSEIQDPGLEAEILLNKGRAESWLDDFEDAADSFTKSIKALERVGDRNNNVIKEEAAAHVNLASSYVGLARPDRALPEYDEALKRFRETDVKDGEAFAWSDRGRANLLMGENASALDDYKNALKLRQEIAVTDVNNQRRIVAILDYIGRTYAQMNDFESALTYYRQALALARKLKYHRFIAYILNDLGLLRFRQNRFESAERYHENALMELKAGDPGVNGIAESQALLGEAQRARGKYNSALKNYREALALQEKSQDKIGQAQTLFFLGMFQSGSRALSEAEDSFKKAAELYHQGRNRVGESNARFQAARMLLQQNKDLDAGAQIAQAIAIAEEVRSFTPGPDLQVSWFITVEKMYRFQVDMLLGARGTTSGSDQLRAFAVLQCAQSRTLLDALEARTRKDLLGNYDAGRACQTLEKQDARLTESSGIQWTDTGDRYPQLGFFSDIISVQDVQRRILDKDSAFIQFYLSEPHSYAWVITQDSIRVLQLPPKTLFRRDVNAVLRFGQAGQWTNQQQLALDHLRRELAPVFAAAPARRWVVVPDGEFHYLPFTLLAAKEKDAEQIIKVPSAAAADILMRNSNPKQPAYLLALFADPVFDALDSRVTGSSGKTNIGAFRSEKSFLNMINSDFLPRLRSTREEATAISQLVSPTEYRLFLDFKANVEAAADNALENFRIVHLATHSVPDQQHPASSRIVFSRVDSSGKPRSGYLLAKDIYRMKLSSDLVVLSSCRSAVGRQIAGEGPMSLARAFLFAGSKSVMASLWEVDDTATADFMQRFYRHLLHDKYSPIMALAAAQSEFRQHPNLRLRNPYYWAGFELYGKWSHKE